MNGYRQGPSWLPTIGCLTIVAVLALMFLMPLLLVDLMRQSLERLHLSQPSAMLTVLGIFIGSIINIPLYRIDRADLQPMPRMGVFGPWVSAPQFQLLRPSTVIAVNVGGCLIPAAVAAWEIGHLLHVGGWPLVALLGVVGANVVACYFLARPVSGIGVMLPVVVAPLTAVLATWLLLAAPEYALVRAPVAFVGGVLGPLVGADLLHLKDISHVAAGMLSIGGAGTFDGIVLSSFLAALLV